MTTRSAGQRAWTRVVASGLLAAGLLAAGGCASAGSSSSRAASTVVDVTERDFHISISRPQVRAGEVVLRVRNLGPDSHELIVVRSPTPKLPLRPDDITVDEGALERATVGALEP